MPVATARSIGAKRRRAPLWPSREAFFTDAGIFALGAAGAFSANIVGALPGNEVLLLPVLPVLLLARGGRAFRQKYLWFYLLTAAWLLGTIIADTYNGSPFSSRLKGIARVVFFALDFITLAILLDGKPRRIVVFALSIVAVMLFIARGFSSEFLTAWKFGLSSSVIIVALLISSYFFVKKRYWTCVGISLFLAGLNLAYAFRSQMVIILISAVLTFPIFAHQNQRGNGQAPDKLNGFRLVAVLLLAGGAAYLANAAIRFAAERGFFTENVADKFNTQSRGKLGVLFGGRPETLVAIQAILEKPIVGHGSFPYSPKYMQLMQDYQYEYGYSDSDMAQEVEYPVIPTHSHLTMAWVESGILGGALWIYILILVIRTILKIIVSRPGLTPLYCYMLVNFLWDILYSPFGSVNRLWGAYLILICYGVLTTPVPATGSAMAHRRVPLRRTLIDRRAPLSPVLRP